MIIESKDILLRLCHRIGSTYHLPQGVLNGDLEPAEHMSGVCFVHFLHKTFERSFSDPLLKEASPPGFGKVASQKVGPLYEAISGVALSRKGAHRGEGFTALTGPEDETTTQLGGEPPLPFFEELEVLAVVGSRGGLLTPMQDYLTIPVMCVCERVCVCVCVCACVCVCVCVCTISI
jgi:hypothetical protein